MSTVSTSRPPTRPPDDADPFRYGWRYVTVRAQNGTATVDQIPLTLLSSIIAPGCRST